jgi:hypothetical protein
MCAQRACVPHTGIPTNILDDYPALQDFRDSIASLPEIAVFYR